MTRVHLVPGLAVRAYLEPATAALHRRGLDAILLAAPGSPEAESDLAAYGARLGAQLDALGGTGVLVGLSVGGQAAAVAASRCRVGTLVLVSPTVDPDRRSVPRLLAAWAAQSRREPPPVGLHQVPDWRRAGARRLLATTRSAVRLATERALESVGAATVVVVHGERDRLSPYEWAATLADRTGRRLVVVPGAGHSWPFGDEERFADLVAEVAGDRRAA